VEEACMYVVFVKEDGKHTISGIFEKLEEVKQLVQKDEVKKKIETGKAYLIEGEIKLIRPEITPELLDLKVSKKEKNQYY
jgi:hypothetical protein